MAVATADKLVTLQDLKAAYDSNHQSFLAGASDATILSMIDAVNDATKSFPASMCKFGTNLTTSDAPTGFESSEWVAVVYGYPPRLECQLTVYGNSYKRTFLRPYFQRAWLKDWTEMVTTDTFGSLLETRTESAGLTGINGVSIITMIKLSIGHLRMYEFRFETSSAIAANTGFISGFDTAWGTYNGTATCILHNNGNTSMNIRVILASDMTLCTCSDALPANTQFRANISYIAI